MATCRAAEAKQKINCSGFWECSWFTFMEKRATEATQKSPTTEVNDPIIKEQNVAVMYEGEPMMEDVVSPVFVPTGEVTLAPFGSTSKCSTRVDLG